MQGQGNSAVITVLSERCIQGLDEDGDYISVIVKLQNSTELNFLKDMILSLALSLCVPVEIPWSDSLFWKTKMTNLINWDEQDGASVSG